MKCTRFVAILVLCAILLSGICGCKSESSASSGKKPEKESQSDDTPSGNGGGTKDPDGNGGSDFWENEEGITMPPITAPSENAEEVADAFLTALQNGDWETANQRIFDYSMQGGTSLGFPEGGILEKIVQSMTVKNRTVTENGDGSYCVNLTVETIDCRSLLEALPEGIESTEEAREEMLRLADTTDRSTFSADFQILRYYENGYYFIEPSESFINAITGGYYDLYLEELEKEAAQ